MRAISLEVTSLCLSVALSIFALHGQETSKPQTSVWDGVYTAEQANHGKSLYNDSCFACHGADLSGNEDIQAPALTGSKFLTKWNGRSMDALFDKIQTTMPVGNPGGLKRDVNRDILAYILSANAFPAGKTELPLEDDKLSQIRFDASKPGAQ